MARWQHCRAAVGCSKRATRLLRGPVWHATRCCSVSRWRWWSASCSRRPQLERPAHAQRRWLRALGLGCGACGSPWLAAAGNVPFRWPRLGSGPRAVGRAQPRNYFFVGCCCCWLPRAGACGAAGLAGVAGHAGPSGRAGRGAGHHGGNGRPCDPDVHQQWRAAENQGSASRVAGARCHRQCGGVAGRRSAAGRPRPDVAGADRCADLGRCRTARAALVVLATLDHAARAAGMGTARRLSMDSRASAAARGVGDGLARRRGRPCTR